MESSHPLCRFSCQSNKILWYFPVKVLEAIEYRYILCPGNLLWVNLLSLKQGGIFKIWISLYNYLLQMFLLVTGLIWVIQIVNRLGLYNLDFMHILLIDNFVELEEVLCYLDTSLLFPQSLFKTYECCCCFLSGEGVITLMHRF